MSEDDLTPAKLRANRQAVIDEIYKACRQELQKGLYNEVFKGREIHLAKQALSELERGILGAKALQRNLSIIDPEIADRLEYELALVMRGLFYAGGLVLTSKTQRASRTSAGLEAIQKNLGQVWDLHREAIRYALAQPPSRPFGKKKGLTAVANRAVIAANRWLKDNNHKADLNASAIQKRLDRDPEDFPRSEGWPE